jgi:hypothetical protein
LPFERQSVSFAQASARTSHVPVLEPAGLLHVHAPFAQPGSSAQSGSPVHESLPKHSPVAPLQSGREAGHCSGLVQRAGGGQQAPAEQTRPLEHWLRSMHVPEQLPASPTPPSRAEIATQVKSDWQV